MPQKVYRMLNGRTLQWLRCADCGADLGPAAQNIRMRKSSHYPIAFAGRDGRTLCGACLRRELGIAPFILAAEGVR